VDPRIRGVVSRPKEIVIIAYDSNGNRLQEKFSGFTARIVQHEIDHLNGIRFPDRVGKDGILHWVEKEELPYYRQTWQTWPNRCPWETWLSLKG